MYNNYLITESEVVTGKSQTEALPYWPSDSEVNTVGRGLRFSRNDRTVEVIKLFIIWLTVWIKEKNIYSSGSRQFTAMRAFTDSFIVSNPGQNSVHSPQWTSQLENIFFYVKNACHSLKKVF